MNQSILKNSVIINCKNFIIDYANYSKKTCFRPYFDRTTAKNALFGASLVIKWEEFPTLIELIGLITSADFNRLSIDLKLAIIDFRISADSQP